MADNGGPQDTPRAALESLKLQVRALREDVDQVRDRVRDLPPDPSERLDKVEAALTRLLAAVDEAPPPFDWDDLEPDDAAKREGQVREWVRTKLIRRYRGKDAVGALLAVRDCWWDHLDARDYITASWLAWVAAYRHAARRGTDPDDWLELRLPRLATALGNVLGNPRQECRACQLDAPDPAPGARAGY